MERKELELTLSGLTIAGLICFGVGMASHLPHWVVAARHVSVHVIACLGVPMVYLAVNVYFPPQTEAATTILENAARSIEKSGVAGIIIIPLELCLLSAPILIPLYGAWWFVADGADHLKGASQKLEFSWLGIYAVGIGMSGYATWFRAGVALFVLGFMLITFAVGLAWVLN